MDVTSQMYPSAIYCPALAHNSLPALLPILLPFLLLFMRKLSNLYYGKGASLGVELDMIADDMLLDGAIGAELVRGAIDEATIVGK